MEQGIKGCETILTKKLCASINFLRISWIFFKSSGFRDFRAGKFLSEHPVCSFFWGFKPYLKWNNIIWNALSKMSFSMGKKYIIIIRKEYFNCPKHLCNASAGNVSWNWTNSFNVIHFSTLPLLPNRKIPELLHHFSPKLRIFVIPPTSTFLLTFRRAVN